MTRQGHCVRTIFGCPLTLTSTKDGYAFTAYDGLRGRRIASGTSLYWTGDCIANNLSEQVYAWLRTVPAHLESHLTPVQRRFAACASFWEAWTLQGAIFDEDAHWGENQSEYNHFNEGE